MKSSVSPWTLVGLFTCFTCVCVQAAEYCLRPGKEDGTEAGSVVCCSTPSTWQGWKDDPRYWDEVKGFTKAVLQASHISSVSFRQPNCKVGSQCVFLDLKTTARDSRGQPDVEAGLRDFVEQLEQLQDLSARDNPCVVVNRFGTFDTENSGVLTIWRILCPSGREHFVTLLAQRDVLVTIDLRGPEIKDIVPKLDSLKELARSVQITEASFKQPDITKVDVRLSDAVIRQQLLERTPRGTPMAKVYQFLQSRLYRDSIDPDFPDEVHRSNGDLYTQIGHYSNPMPTRPVSKPTITTDEELRTRPQTPPMLSPQTVIRAFWKFDKQRKLRDIEVRRDAE